MSKAIALVYSSNEIISNQEALNGGLASFANRVWRDVKLTNQSMVGKATKTGASLIVGGTVAKEFGAFTPLKWVSGGFGPLPAEFTKSGAIQVFEYTTLERLKLVALSTGAKFILVALAFESGVMVGSIINQSLSTDAQDAIGGTINEIINNAGWKELWRHPFGIGM